MRDNLHRTRDRKTACRFRGIVLLAALAYYAHTQILAVQIEWRRSVAAERDAYREALLAIKQVPFRVAADIQPEKSPAAPQFSPQPQTPSPTEAFSAFQKSWMTTEFDVFEAWAERYYNGHRPEDKKVVEDYTREFGWVPPLEAMRA